MATQNFIDHPHGTNSYLLRIRGSHMWPVLREGWFVTVHPSRKPVVGEYVSIKLRTGEKLIRELHDQRAMAIVVGEVNGPRRTSISTNDIEHLHATGGIMPPSHGLLDGGTSEGAASPRQ